MNEKLREIKEYLQNSQGDYGVEDHVKDIAENMRVFLRSDQSPYRTKHIKQLLNETYGDRIVITDIGRHIGVVTFRQTAHKILRDFYRTKQPSEEEEL